MPLPFLTADRVFEAADDVPLPYDDRDRWRRPYRPGPWRVGVAALALLLASFVLFALALLVIAAALRLLRMGVWVSARGLRHVGFLTTRTAPWAQVVSVRTVQQPVRWLGLPRTVQGQTLLLGRQGDPAGPVPLMTTHNADFVGRAEAFDRAADSVEAWAEEYGPR